MKKIMSVFLLFLTVILPLGQTVSAQPVSEKKDILLQEGYVPFIPGDADCDGTMTILDATCIQRKIADYSVPYFNPIAADTGNLGYYSILNATHLQRIAAGLSKWYFKTFSQENAVTAAYLSEVEYDPGETSVSYIEEYYGEETSYQKYCPAGIEITSPENGIITFYGRYDTYSYPVTQGKNTIYNLLPGSVTKYVIRSVDGEFLKSDLLLPTGNIRMIHADNAQNVRDLGGWDADGGKVRYGKIFRGAQDSEQDAFLFHDVLHIRAELDLRWETELNGKDHSLIGGDVSWKHINGAWYTTYTDPTRWESDSLKRSVEYLMDCAIENKPVYFHCVAGADRTGTVAFLIEAILGVSRSDIDKDYELTCFYTGFDAGVLKRCRNNSPWGQLMNQFRQYKGSTINHQVVNWALSQGISLDKINAFRQAMIDGDPVVLTTEMIKE